MTEAQATAPPEPPSSTQLDHQVEPAVGTKGAPCYSQALKTGLILGMFALLMGRSTTSTCFAIGKDRDNIVARIVTVTNSQSSLVSVNICMNMNEAPQQTEGVVCPNMLGENHLRHLTEIVQTTKLCAVFLTASWHCQLVLCVHTGMPS